MRRVIGFSLILIALSLFLRFFLLSTPAPEIEIHPSAITLGELEELQRARTSFAVHNKSRADYTVVGLSSDCHCTGADISWPQKLSPGQSLEVPIVYDTKRGDGLRTQRLALMLEKNGKGKPVRFVKLIPVSCTIKPELRSTPALLDMGDLGPDDNSSVVRFNVRSMGDVEYRVDSIETTSKHVIVQGPETIDHTGGEFVAKFTPEQITAKGTYAGSVEITVSGGRVDRFSIPFRATVSPRFLVTPDTIVFDAGSAVGSKETTVFESIEPFRIVDLSTPESIEVEGQSAEFALRHELRFKIADPTDGIIGEVRACLLGRSGKSQTVSVKVERVPVLAGEKSCH